MLQLTKGFSSIIAVPIIPQNTLFQTEPGLTSQVPKAGRRMKRGQSSGQLLNSPVGPLHGHPLKQQQPPGREHGSGPGRALTARLNGSGTLELGSGSWFLSVPAGTRQEVLLCVHRTHCGWSKGLSVDPELLGNQTPLQSCSTELRNILRPGRMCLGRLRAIHKGCVHT